MKLLTYKIPGEERERLGVTYASAFQRFFALEDLGLFFEDMNDLIEHITPEQFEILKNPRMQRTSG